MGDTVYVPTIKHVKKREPCPVCFGTKKVTLVLGNGTALELDCDYCASGFNPPTGEVVTTYYLAGEVEKRTIIGMDARGGYLTYYTHCLKISDEGDPFLAQGSASACDVFSDPSDAMIRAQEMADAEVEERERIKYHQKEKAHKSFSWHAGYHMREYKKALQEAEFHLTKYRIIETMVPGADVVVCDHCGGKGTIPKVSR
jgi:hypothetical protein